MFRYSFILLIMASAAEDLNLRPIIGILSQEPSSSMIQGNEDKKYKSYIASSYVKYIESAGARVVPIMINKGEDYYRNIADSVNGILFPGGANSIYNDSGYGMAGQILFEKIMEKNSAGHFMPLWATCLGFEMLVYLAGGYQEMRADCWSQNQPLPLITQPGYDQSDLFNEMPEDIEDIITTENVTINYHKYCYTKENFTKYGIDDQYRILTTNYDWDDFEFISTVEHYTYPIYATQWHPEKNAYEWKNDEKRSGIPHQKNAVYSVQYLADFFVNKARRNNQSFSSLEEETEALIYAYCPTFVANTSTAFTQVYFFEGKSSTTTVSVNYATLFIALLILNTL